MFKKIKHRFNIYRRFKYWKRAGCVFVHVPKVAGTSVNHAIYGKTLGHYSASEIESSFPELFENVFTFTLVRNPWDRVLSAYRFAKKGKTETMGMYKPEQYEIPEFETFESFVVNWLAHKDVDELDFVFQTQSKFLTDNEGGVMVDYVGKLESLDESIKFIESRLNRKLVIPHANKVARNGSYHDYYTSQESIDIVSSKYAKDIELFNYKF